MILVSRKPGPVLLDFRFHHELKAVALEKQKYFDSLQNSLAYDYYLQCAELSKVSKFQELLDMVSVDEP